MNNEIWLSLEEVCELTDNKRETVRRKCKSGEYKTKSDVAGRKKIYHILLSSLPIKQYIPMLKINFKEYGEIILFLHLFQV